MKRAIPIHWLALFIWGMSSLAGAQPGQESPQAFNFSPRALEDGSETFDALVLGRDGLFVYTCIRKPPGKGPFPGVILVHGGLGGSLNGARNLALRSTPADAFIKSGYALLSTDYRKGDWMTEYQDVISAYEYFRQLSFIRSDAIAMMGGSRGGKLTLDVASRVRLQAAVPCAGPYDVGKFYEYCRTSEFHQKLMKQLEGGGGAGTFMKEVREQLGGTPAEVPDEYWRHSGISRVSDVETPMLIVHGERDIVVPPSFGRELVSALRKHGKVVEEHFAENGSHSFYWGFPIHRGTATKEFAELNQLFVDQLLVFLEKYLGSTGN